jgi:drug/metabolite transporter (DMT)-like permease
MKIALGFLLMISCTVMANLLMKLGAAAPGAAVFLGLLSWTTVFGLAAFGTAGMLYAWLLKWMPLNLAQSFAAAQFIAVILASDLFLSERIPLGRWIGIAMIAAGIVVVGFTAERDVQEPSISLRQER